MFRRSVTLSALEMPATTFKATPWTGQSAAEMLAKRQKYMLGAFAAFYKEPLALTQGHMQYLYDTKGDRYLDMYGCIVTVGVGHSHPRLAEVCAKVASTVNHTAMIYLHNAVSDYCEAIANKLPNYQEWTIVPVNSGSEATDLSMAVMRLHSKNNQIYCMRNAYHGMTEGARGMMGLKGWKHNLQGPTGVSRVISPHPTRGLLGTKPEDVSKYLVDLENQIHEETPGKVAGMFIERIQGAGGAAPLLDGYQRQAFEIIKKHGGVTVADEVQGGFGRTGKKFFSFELDDAKPDIVNMAKSVANGWPMAVCAINKEVAKSMNGVNLVNTYGGNAMSCSIAHEVLRIIEDEKLMQNCDVVGTHLIEGMKKMQAKYPQLIHVRGYGLMLGAEFVAKAGTMEPGSALVGAIHERLKTDHKILIGKGGNFGSCLRIAPPMCFTMADADYYLECFEDVLSKECKQ